MFSILDPKFLFSQFRALSDQFYRSPEHHKFVREQVVSQVVIYIYIYSQFPWDFSAYALCML